MCSVHGLHGDSWVKGETRILWVDVPLHEYHDPETSQGFGANVARDRRKGQRGSQLKQLNICKARMGPIVFLSTFAAG